MGELDGDPEPEIVIDYNGYADSELVSGIAVYDHTLTEVWRRPSDLIGWNPFHLADLDGDGIHEIIVREAYALTILDGAGETLASIEAGYGNNLWRNVPVVVDVDGDGLAEIVTSGAEPSVQVWENAAGGWLVDGAEEPSSGVDHHPGALEVDGSVPAASPWWLDANVWQGHAASGVPQLADLEVSVEAVCAEDCGEELYVTLYVANTGVADVLEPIDVLVARGDGSRMFAAQVTPPLAAGTSTALELRVSPDDARYGLTFTVDPDGAVLECDEGDNVVTWSDTPCP